MCTRLCVRVCVDIMVEWKVMINIRYLYGLKATVSPHMSTLHYYPAGLLPLPLPTELKTLPNVTFTFLLPIHTTVSRQVDNRGYVCCIANILQIHNSHTVLQQQQQNLPVLTAYTRYLNILSLL